MLLNLLKESLIWQLVNIFVDRQQVIDLSELIFILLLSIDLELFIILIYSVLFTTDMTIRCCLAKHGDQDNVAEGTVNTYLRGLALATCCHHLCQWKHYISKFLSNSLDINQW